ncbi:hypothetical protein BSKO_02051 [Bryopsis sp. KO-2023]|nr:hypothetical protein BSKO_02051 [Bryopsis sp. KO-2023]
MARDKNVKELSAHRSESSSIEIGHLEWPPLKSKTATSSCSMTRFLVASLLTCSVVVAFLFVDRSKLQSIAVWLESHRSGSGMAIFFFLCILGVVCVVPGPVMAIIAGALYGKFLGGMLVWTSGTIGQSATFLLGRFLLRDWVVNFASKHISKFQIIDTVISREGWKLVLLLRLSPLLPDSLLNYVLSVTSIKYFHYAWSSSLAILPWSIVFSYVGSLAHSVAEAAGGGVHISSKTMYFWAILSLFFLLIMAWYTARISKRALAEALEDKTTVEAYRK